MTHIALVAAVIVLAWLANTVMAAAPGAQPWSYWVFIGTSTHSGASKGIYLCRLDMPDGTMTYHEPVAELPNPTYLALHPSGKYLYAVGELPDGPGVIRAYQISPVSGNLTLLNEQSSGGAGPTHLEIDRGGKNILVANYGGGSVAVLPIEADGKLSPPTCVIQHHGSSINPKRQTKPYAHSINLDPAQKFAIACDLGCDKLFIYRYDANAGKLTLNDPPFAEVKPGSGPRHMAFSANGKFAYVINEMESSITVFSYDADRGALNEIQTISTLPKEFISENTGAEILLNPSGKVLYASNRGQNRIVIFDIDQATGKLTPAGSQSTQGKTPRFFGIDPRATLLLAANQDSNSLLVMKIEPGTGHLIPGAEMENIPSPTCAVFLPIAK